MPYPRNRDDEQEGAVAQDQLRNFVGRIESLDDQIAALNADKSQAYKDAKAEGFDVKVLRKVVAERRKDEGEREEQSELFDLYWTALAGLVRAHVETIEEFDPETGEITEPAMSVDPAVDQGGEGAA